MDSVEFGWEVRVRDGVWEAARLVRAELPDRVGRDAALVVDQQLAVLLNGPVTDQATAALEAALSAHMGTRVFMEAVLGDPQLLPPAARELVSRSVSFQPLAGEPDPGVLPVRYVCPGAVPSDYAWYRVGARPVPRCPTHDVDLVLADPGAPA